MKLCPLKFNSNQEVVEEGYLCEEDECAWWEPYNKQCIIHELTFIADGALDE